MAAEAALPRLDAYLPPELQDRLREATLRLRGERRRVAFLFADLVGSTDLGHRSDLELVKLVLDQVLATMIESVFRFEGTVARLQGDGLLAFFGAPLTHEDDTERALGAALEIRSRIARLSADLKRDFDLPVQVRIGINAGEVIVGELGSDLRLEYTAVGDPINLAARLQAKAEPAEVLVGEAVYREGRASFAFGDRLQVSVKGVAEPIAAYPLLDAKPEPESKRGIEGRESPLVGREAELGALGQAFEELLSGRGQILLLLGEAGIGKSRLLEEARRTWATNVTWAEGRCLSYGGHLPFHPFVEAVQELAGIRASDSETAVRFKLHRALIRLAPEERTRHAAFLQNLLSLGLERSAQDQLRFLSPETLTQRLAQAIGALLAALAAERPVLVALDDLHWADQASLQVLETLLEVMEEHPVGVALLMRPDTEAPAWRLRARLQAEHFHRLQEVQLRPLSDGDAGRLLDGLVRLEDLPSATRELLLRRSEGNPFFLEELLRSLLEREVIVPRNGKWVVTEELEDLEVPETLQKVILARVDRLSGPERAVLQAASVVGRRFAYGVVERVVGEPVREQLSLLVRRDFVRERSQAPGIEYYFKHWLTRDAVYGMLLETDRRDLHRRAGEAIEALWADRLEEQAALLAQHFTAAAEREKAVEYAGRAGDAAMRSGAMGEAIHAYRQALAQDPAAGRAAGLWGKLAEALANSARTEEGWEAWARAVKLAAAGDHDQVAAYRARWANSQWLYGEPEETRLAFLEGALTEAQAQPPGVGKASLLHEASRQRVAAGDTAGARRELAEAERALGAAGKDHGGLRAQILLTRAWILRKEEAYQEATRLVEEAIAAAQAAGDIEAEARGWNNLSSEFAQVYGRPRSGAVAADHLRQLGEQTGNLKWIVQASQAKELTLDGRPAEALEVLAQDEVRLGHRAATFFMGLEFHRMIGLAAMGRTDEALAVAARAVEQPMSQYDETDHATGQGAVRAALGRHAEALSFLRAGSRTQLGPAVQAEVIFYWAIATVRVGDEGELAAAVAAAEALPPISPFLQAVTPFVRALARGDVQGMLEAAAPMEAEGYAWLAYRARWEAAWLLAEAGHVEEAAGLRGQVQAWAQPRGVVYP